MVEVVRVVTALGVRVLKVGREAEDAVGISMFRIKGILPIMDG